MHLRNFKVRQYGWGRMLCAALLLHDKLSSHSPSDMSNRFMRHVRGTRFGSIRAIVIDIWTIVSGTWPIILGTWPIISGTWPIVLGTQPIVSGTDMKFTGCIDLVALEWIHRHSDNSSRQNRVHDNFTSQWHKHTYELVLCSDTINQI
jgi:hypothetical protein